MPERTPYIAANWKMNKTVAEAAEFVDALLPRIAATQRDVVLCPPFTALAEVVERAPRDRGQGRRAEHARGGVGRLHRRGLGADAGRARRRGGRSSATPSGASTSTRPTRRWRAKVPAALAADLEPILCVGESEEARDGGETEEVLERQLQADLAERSRRPTSPRSSSPTSRSGRSAPAAPRPPSRPRRPAPSSATCCARRGAAADEVRILYGGSVKPGNAAELLALPDVDGALVGGAALDAEDFAAIVEARLRVES